MRSNDHDGVLDGESALSADRDGELPDEHVEMDDEWVRVTETHYDRESGRELATALVFAIADAKGVDPLDHSEMPPLYESVDVQSLEDTFFGPSGHGPERDEAVALTFTYADLKVTLRADGWIFVSEPR